MDWLSLTNKQNKTPEYLILEKQTGKESRNSTLG